MRRTHALLILFSISLLIGVRSAAAQQDTTAVPVRITLLDGTTYTGTIVLEDEDTVHLRTTAGAEITIPKAQIKSREAIEAALAHGRFTRLDPNRTRLLFAPTARALKAGQGYFADHELILPFAAVGITDRISLGGGISIIPADIEQLVYLAPKATLYTTEKVGVAVGAFLFSTTRFEDAAGLVYGATTIGPQTRAITAGVGFAFGNDRFYSRPALMLGGEVQLSNSIKLLSENYYIPSEEGSVTIVSGAIRFFGDRLAADLGLLTSPEIIDDLDAWPFFPYVSFAYNFGHH